MSINEVNPAALNQMVEDIDKLKWAEKERQEKEANQVIYDVGYDEGKKACFKKLCKKKRKTCFKNECMPAFVIWMMAGAVLGSFLCTLIFFAFYG